MSAKKKTERIGEINYNNQGLKMVIIGYKDSSHVDIEFEDGYIKKNSEYRYFKNGKINNPNYPYYTSNYAIGETVKNCQGIEMELIEYFKYNNISVKFKNDNHIIKNRTYQEFKNGSIKNPYCPDVYNVGYIGDGKYKTRKDNKTLKSYTIWQHMLRRCYDNKFQETNPTYKDCTVCKEWHNFQNFAEWYEDNYYEVDNETMCIDKDILFKGNKIYSPDTCLIVTQKINNLFVKSNKIRGKSPIGVYYSKNENKYKANISINNTSKTIGTFKTELEAFQAYKEFKEKLIKEIADEYKNKIPEKLYNAMYNWKVEVTD